MALKAVLGKEVTAGKRFDDTKETCGSYTLVAATRNDKIPTGFQFDHPVRVTIYCGRSRSASTVWATIRAGNDTFHCSGSGSASGYGYCKRSAAVDAAINAAKIELFGSAYTGQGGQVDYTRHASISGVGESAIEAAIYAIGEALGFPKESCTLVTT